MFVQQNLKSIFEEFCSFTGQSEFRFLKSRVRPDLMFEWFGDPYWGYHKSGGYEIFGEDIDRLEELWEKTLHSLLKDKDEPKSE